MSARDELARDIFLADNWRMPAPAAIEDWDALARSTQSGNTYAHNIASRLIAAGYRKPRKVYTTAELDDLPESSVVLDESGTVALQIGRGLWSMGGEDYTSKELTADWLLLPATVLHEPEA